MEIWLGLRRETEPRTEFLMKVNLGAIVLAGLLSIASGAAPASEHPLKEVRSTAEKIVSILSEPALQGEAKKAERRRLIKEELETRFDWNTICRSSLGRHWTRLSGNQQKEFIELFKQFLERTYLDRIEPYYRQLDEIKYHGERILENRYASVKTSIVTTQKIEHPVEYRLELSASGAWQVYDIVIEGVSLVKNYRTQFDEIVARSSVQGLLDDLKAKIAANQT